MIIASVKSHVRNFSFRKRGSFVEISMHFKMCSRSD